MSLAKQLAPHLPSLRRYGHVLSGSKSQGDVYVRATLEAIVAAPAEFPRDVNPRLGLYRIFQAIWNSANNNFDGDVTDCGEDQERAMRAHLARMTPLSRQALLLTAMEGFTREDTAYLIGVDKKGVETLVSDAFSKIEKQNSANINLGEKRSINAINVGADTQRFTRKGSINLMDNV